MRYRLRYSIFRSLLCQHQSLYEGYKTAIHQGNNRMVYYNIRASPMKYVDE